MHVPRRIRQSCALAILLLGAPNPGECAATTADQQAADEIYIHCLQRSAAQLDDGTSDVTGIALAVKSACSSQFISAVKAHAQGMSFEAYQMLRNRLEAQSLPEAAEAVMQVRASRSQSSPSRSQSTSASQAPTTAGNTSDTQLKKSFAAYKTGNYTEAMTLLKPLADQGNAEAEYGVGIMYDYGQGVPQNKLEAAKWYSEAAEQGNAAAQDNLGAMYNSGAGVTQDHVEAAKWWRRAADQGYADAQFYLGAMYFLGQGVPQDYVIAHMWLNLAAAGGDKDAIKQRDMIAPLMTPAQIAEAQKLAREWKPK